jgi:type II secretory pathway component GspD/PulD (secretin)
MAEARQCVREDRLLDARAKLLEAQKLGATFAPGEDTPEFLSQHLAFRARQRIDALVGRANETLRFGSGDLAGRMAKAEEDLTQARRLAAGFGQDTSGVDRLLVVVRQQRGAASAVASGPAPATVPAPAAAPVPPPAPGGVLPPVVTKPDAVAVNLPPVGAGPAAVPPAPGSGQELLEKARLELRSGQTDAARRLAEMAYEPRYGVRDQAVALLRTIDTEDFNQKRLRAIRVFDAAWSAYLKRDYAHCGNMVAAIDTRLLDEARQAKLRDMMATPEMQPAGRAAVVQAAGPGDGGSELPPEAGRSVATDNPDTALLRRTQAMRDVLFQKLRKDGLEVQSAALEKYRSGQPDAAVEMLHDYLNALQDKQLDPGQMALLKRPVEARMKQLQLLQAQEEFANRTASKHEKAKNAMASIQMAEQTKQKNVAELMKQYNALYREGKYAEAEAMAMRAHELDPDNAIVGAAIQIAKRQENISSYKKLKGDKEDLVLHALNDTDKEGDKNAVDNGISISKEGLERIHNRKDQFGSTIKQPRKSDKEREIERQLSTPVTLNFTDAPLKSVIDDLRAFKGINIWVNEAALAEEGISLDRPVSVKLDQVSLHSALNLILQNVHLTYCIRDEVLQITTRKDAQGKLAQTTYQVADLIIPVNDFGTVGAQPNAWTPAAASPPVGQQTPSPITGAMTLQNGTAVGVPAGSSSSAAPGGPFASQQGSGSNITVTKKNATTTEDTLIKLITNTVAPQSWSDMGGPGTIDYYPNTMALVINQTPDIQDQIAELLEALRRLQDQEVAVEIRFITIAEDFYERIGVNFNLNFVQRQNAKFEPSLTSGNFSPDGFVNVFQPGRFLAGLTPAGTLTPDLNIPLTVQTFQQALPPFGGYPGIPGAGGITLGLAFLSDIQVFLFMEAAQGDTRTNVMQAPKLTMFNGQTATLTVGDSQNFVTNISVIPQQGIFTFNPTVSAVPMFTTLTMNAVISADRRFVRMSLTPALTNLASDVVPLFPIVVPIFPNLDNTGTGQPVVFTQFIQQPRTTAVSVATTVAVPDGGTVLMGGMKRLSEGRTEFGPPILSKIPYINRLFKNVGYGRNAESLLIMVTPRIIIQAEEEQRQTGYVPRETIVP